MFDLRIAVCDDDRKQLEHLCALLREWSAEKPFTLEISEYSGAEQFMFRNADVPCELLLLDIEMTGMNGMELAKKLRESSDMLPIIFITGFSEYMSEGYDVEALHYLLKPVDKKKLFAVLDRYLEKHGTAGTEIMAAVREGTVHIPTGNIVYIEAFGKKTQLHLRDGSVLDCEMSIGTFSKKNISGFISPHRSYLVNLRYVRSIGKTSAVLDSGAEIPLSRRSCNEVNRAFIEFYTEQDRKIQE